MDKFIESFEKKSASQKILITLVVTVILLLIIALLYFLTGSSGSDSNRAKELGGKSSQDSTSRFEPTPFIPESRLSKDWYTYIGSSYQISYPSDLEGRPGVVDGGSSGSSFIIQGQENQSDFNIELQITDATKASVLNISKIFKDFGFKEEQVIVNNRSASKFSGEELGFQKIAVLFEDSNKTYKFQVIYLSPNSIPKIEQIFNKIISTFILN